MSDVGYNDTHIGGTTGGFLIWNIDKASVPGMTFIGAAPPNTLSTAAVWKILVIDNTTAITRIRYAESNSRFDKVWDDRAGYAYG